VEWDTVILDNLRPTIMSVCTTYPDHRHLSGVVSPEWILLNDVLGLRKTTIIYTEVPPTDIDLIDYIFLLQTQYRGETFIQSVYTRERAAVVRLTETLLLEGIIQNLVPGVCDDS
jgi:hypothetical protein